MNDVTWTKQGLQHALNTRMDQGKFDGQKSDFIMSADISDDLLVEWQIFYDENKGNPLVVEHEYARVYNSIIASF
jgi:GH43 family beta-xylosidase